MSKYLRQSTASQEILIGYMVDSTDGNTEETALTIANTDIKLHKAGATTLANKNSGGATHISNGLYYAVLDATDTDTLGNLAVRVHVSGALPFEDSYVVLSAVNYDALVAGTDNFDVNVAQWLGTACATPTTNGVPEVDVTHYAGIAAQSNVSGCPNVNVTHWLGTAAATPTVAGVPEVDVTHWIGTAAATPTTAGVPEVDITHIAGAAVSTTTAQLGVNVVQISADATAADNLELFMDGTGYAGGTTPLQVVLTSSGVGAVADGVLDEAITDHRTANSLGAVLQPLHSGACQAGGNTTTVVLASSASSADDYYNGDLIVGWVTADGTNKFADYIADYTGATRTATVTGIPVSPGATYTYVVLPGGSIPGASAPTASEVADAVLDEALSGHTTEGTVGALFGTQHLHAGTAQAGGAASITLDATGSSTTVDFYKYNIVVIRAGTGAGQARQISAYSAARVATVSPAWTTQPSTDSEYVIIPLGIDASTPSTVATAVWAATRAANATAGSFGEYVLADATRISGDATAADNAESFFDGTGYAGTNNTIPTVTTVGTLTGHTAQTGDTYARLGAPAGASVSADIAAVKVDTAAILVDTGTTLDTAIGTLTTNVATVDTVVDAIKVKTDSLAFTVAGQVDANVQSINDVTVAGDGGTTTPWGV